MKAPNRQGFTLIELLVVITIIALIAGMAMPAMQGVQDRANIMSGSSNCRQIIAALKLYASDENGLYPDSNKEMRPETANDAFRLLIRKEILNDEKIFTCKNSKFKGDNNVGEAPEYAEALEAGENHWAMSKDCSDSSPGNYPVVFENPASAAWPPTWNCDVAGQPKQGRAWKGGKIIVGTNDGSVEAIQLESTKGSSVGPKPLGSGKDIFTNAAEEGEILDIQAE
jgi:prepilin-type N-terminal cleavage/methylation domain-containing protein